MDRRRILVTVLAVLCGSVAGRASAQFGKTYRIGVLTARSRLGPSTPDIYSQAFVEGMRELGYVEGKNLSIEWRFADGKHELFPEFAAELVRLKVGVITAHGTPPTLAAKRATGSIPIVAIAVGDPVGSGMAATLARPGGNITGYSIVVADVSRKQLELLKSMEPGVSRVAVLMNPDTPPHTSVLKDIQAVAGHVHVKKILPVAARSSEEIGATFIAMKQERADALIVLADSFFSAQVQRRQITELAVKHRLPSLYAFREDVEAGGLLSYGVNQLELFRRSANYVDKILKGARPADLPFEQPTKIHLALNLKTAKALGLAIPKELLLRADEVIE